MTNDGHRGEGATIFHAKAKAAAALFALASLTFEPGARTAWHTHPLGQTLIVNAGFGLGQLESGPIEEIRPGDWFAPGEKHWHGATPTTAMTHIAIQEKKDGKVVDWMEPATSNIVAESSRDTDPEEICRRAHLGRMAWSFLRLGPGAWE